MPSEMIFIIHGWCATSTPNWRKYLCKFERYTLSARVRRQFHHVGCVAGKIHGELEMLDMFGFMFESSPDVNIGF